MDLRVRQFAGQRKCDTAGAGADVEQAQAPWSIEVILLYQFKNGFHYMLGFRPRNQHRGRNQKVQAPEFLMPGDVLRGTATGALTNDFIVTGLVVFTKLALRMGIKIRAFAIENKQQQQFGVQARRGHVIFNEQLVCGINGLLELHAGELYRKGRQ